MFITIDGNGVSVSAASTEISNKIAEAIHQVDPSFSKSFLSMAGSFVATEHIDENGEGDSFWYFDFALFGGHWQLERFTGAWYEEEGLITLTVETGGVLNIIKAAEVTSGWLD